MTEEQIKLAGQMIKVLYLAALPGMDEVAIKLNCGLTWDEQRNAEVWAKAFELAKRGGKLFDLARELKQQVMR